ncbi:MAG: DUF2905 domain-containing protein [Flavobacteriaceae bacterium]
MGRTLIFVGVVLVVVGCFMVFGERIDYKNPLDFKWEGKNSQIYFPLGTSILISIVLSLVLYLLRK